ncbi:protein FAM222B-like [Hippocampus zosterae]|uniref:protein FAM222B-like n=1 Tax=Hippocampus zosterae TaxID=109293 RepID=UPI00223DB4BB|nr:protein FAM222B-like [Hippocampus zosterae]
MNPYAAPKEAPFLPHDLTLPASSPQTHGLPPPTRRLTHDPLQQHRGAAPAPRVACLPVPKHQTPPAPRGLLAAAPLDLCHMSKGAVQMCGPGFVGSQTPSAALGGIHPPHSQTLGAIPGGLHPRRSMSGNLQSPHPQMPGALHPPQHPQTTGTVPGGCVQTPGLLSGGLQQAPAGAYGACKLPDSDAPPNVTVSTSTIPLSMAASLHHRGGDLSSIVHQINQLCQARAEAGATSVCEGQIANPSPISRNLLISASSRVSAAGPPDILAAPPPTAGAAIRLQPGLSVANAVAAFPADAVQLRRECVWTQHRPPPEGVHPCKSLRLDRAAESAFPARALGYLCKPARADPPGSPPPIVPPGPRVDGDCLDPAWGGSQVPAGFQAGRVVGAKYRLGKESLPGRTKMASDLDFLRGRDVVAAGFPDPDLDSVGGSAACPPRNAACALNRAYR